MYIQQNVKLHSVLLYDDGSGLEIIRRIPSNMCYGNGKHVPDELQKTIYKVIDGKLKFVENVKGKMIPAYTVDEKENWD